jgi:hypothetical protein
MSNIDTILKSAAPAAMSPDRAVIDADLARGRAALAVSQRRRTYRRLSAGAGASLALAAVVVIAATSGGGAHTLTTNRPAATPGVQANTGSAPHTGHAGASTIKLVDYTGAQLAGFTVTQVPQGWHLSTSTPYALLITPDGSTDNNPEVFIGKLAVLTSSTDQQGLGSGDAVTVNGKAGVVSRQSGYLMLNYNAPNGFGVNIQAPDSLGWSEAQIVAFADGITVTAHAVHSHG